MLKYYYFRKCPETKTIRRGLNCGGVCIFHFLGATKSFYI